MLNFGKDRLYSMNSETELFFQNLSAIQNEVISVALIRQNNYNNIEEILTDVSYEVLYRCMELIDGYYCPNTQYRLKNLLTGIEVNENLDLHNFCQDYLRYTDK